ncbi:hypothetical protein [Sphingobacterium lactis]|uniref:hypothetical protein n=1 Tax=Sphingobacterium lactis TaxID=797291 RepID=UPI003DA24F48
MIKTRLASTLGRRDEEPNIILAREIVQSNDQQSIADLIQLIQSKHKELQNDSIKVLYEIGELQPALLQPYIAEFLLGLKSKNNRLQWGSMTALRTISAVYGKEIFCYIPELSLAVADGSVITRDNFIGILNNLFTFPEHRDIIFPLLLEQLQHCPSNQLPMYAEAVLPKIDKNEAPSLRSLLAQRLDEFDKESKRKRLERVIKKLG